MTRAPTPRPREALAAIAELLTYPSADAPRRAAALAACRAAAPADALAPLDRFGAFLEATPPAELEESYTATFDLDPDCAPYVGHHLCGESPSRGVFLAALAGVHGRHGFAPAGELPDHVSEVARFLATAGGPERDELLRDGAAVAVERMLRALERESPWRDLVAALGLVLRADPAAAGAAEGREVRP